MCFNQPFFQVLRRLDDSNFDTSKFIERQMSTTGGRPTKLLKFQDAIELVMVLPGKIAKTTRAQFKTIIQRYMAGDLSLVGEIQNNASSASPVAEMARGSLGIQNEPLNLLKRKREETAIQREEAEIRKLEIENNKSRISFFLDTIQLIDPNWQKDTRLLIQTKDLLKNATFNPAAGNLIENGDRTVTISDVALEMGYGKLDHSRACIVGKRLAQLYQEKHKKKPEKREQYVDGCPRMINSYTEQDKDLIVEALGILDSDE